VGSCSARCLSCGTVGQLELHPAAREEAGSELPCGTWPHPTARHRSRGETFCGRRVGTWHRPAHLIWFPCLRCERSAFTAFQERRRKPAFGDGNGREGANTARRRSALSIACQLRGSWRTATAGWDERTTRSRAVGSGKLEGPSHRRLKKERSGGGITMAYVIVEPCIDARQGLRRGLPSGLHLREAEPALHPP
jgi:hypothetical protein